MTWHEDPDCQTIMKVPTILHGNLPHNGGVNAMKKTGIDTQTNVNKQVVNRDRCSSEEYD